MAKVVISEFMASESVEALEIDHEVVYDKDLVNQQERLLELVSDCDALIVRNKTQVRDKLLDQAKKLKVVGRLGVGLDNIDLPACRERGIEVIPATGANSVSVAEYVLAGLLMLARGCYHMSSEVASGAWPREAMVGGELFEKKLGLVGFGGIAREVAVRAKAFGMQVVAHDPFVPKESPIWEEYGVRQTALPELLSFSDAVSIHVPLTNETRNLLDEARIQSMKKGAFIINTARGGIVDEEALANALRRGHLGGAMLDVFQNEPLKANTPLAGLANCLLTPHIAGVTRESNARVSGMIAARVDRALRS